MQISPETAGQQQAARREGLNDFGSKAHPTGVFPSATEKIRPPRPRKIALDGDKPTERRYQSRELDCLRVDAAINYSTGPGSDVQRGGGLSLLPELESNFRKRG